MFLAQAKANEELIAALEGGGSSNGRVRRCRGGIHQTYHQTERGVEDSSSSFWLDSSASVGIDRFSASQMGSASQISWARICEATMSVRRSLISDLRRDFYSCCDSFFLCKDLCMDGFIHLCLNEQNVFRFCNFELLQVSLPRHLAWDQC